MSKRLGFALLLLPALAAASCSSCGTGVGQAKEGTLTGSIFKGPVATADVVAFDGNSGRRGEQIGAGKTADDGTFSISVGSHEGPIVVCATKGTYTEEATGGLVQLGANELCGLVTEHEAGATSNVVITPLTTLHTALTGCFVDSGRDADFAAAESHAALRLNDFFAAGQSNFDIRGLLPLDPTTTVAPSLTSEAWAGILIAGLSESAKGYAVASGLDPGVRVTAATLTAALAQDIDDGACVFDGRTATSQLIQGDIQLNENALRGSPQGLSTSILRFLESGRNLSGISEQSVRDLVQTMQAHRSEIFGGGSSSSDIDGPVVLFSEPTPNSTRGGLVRVVVTATDASEITEFAFIEPAQSTFTSAVFTCADDTKTSCSLSGNLNTSQAPVVAGPTTISVRVVDASGNPTTGTLSFVVNNSIPQIVVTSPAADEAVEGTTQIVATATDADGIESLTVEIPGIGVCSDQPGSPCPDLEPATDTLRVSWDTTQSPEGDTRLTFRAEDSAGQSADVPHNVVVDNNALTVINGAVDIGAPVAGATVTALVWDARVRGAVLGTSTTDDTGAFSITMDDQAHASVLLVATGGTFVDLATGNTQTIADGQELTSAVGAIAAGVPRVANINAWTTLAAARAKHTPATTDDNNAITTNTNLLSQHLRRVPLGSPFNAALVKSADLTTEVVTISDQRAVLALSHAAISRLAAEISAAAGSFGSVTSLELVRVLVQDLNTDPLLDGIAQGSTLTIGPDEIPVTSATTRFDLAAALDRWLSEAPIQGGNPDRNNSSITRLDALNGRLYEALAEDNRGDLYPDAGQPFDVDPPTIDLSFGGVHSTAQPGDALRGTVQINGNASDDAGEVVAFGATITADGAFLVDDDGADERLRVFIGTNVLPNSAAAAEACINAPDALEVAELDDAVCVCAIAHDEQANIAERILCFTRPLPGITFETPSPAPGASITGTAVIAARASSGFDLASFNVTGAATALSATQPTSDTLQLSVPTSFVDEANKPNIVIGLQATDIAGRSTPASLTFTRPAPTTAISSPLANTIITTGQSVQLTASATSGYNLQTCTASLTASPAQAAPAFNAPTRSGPDCSFSALIAATALPDATWTLTVNATDIAGRAATPATRTFVVDDTLPGLVPATAPVTLVGVRRTITAVGNELNIAADDPTSTVLPRSSTYNVVFTARDNFAISRAVVRVDLPGGAADILRCIPATAGACDTSTAVFTNQLVPCNAQSNCTVGGTKNGDSFSVEVVDRSNISNVLDDGPRTVSVDLFDVNGNRAALQGQVTLNKDTVAPVFTWRSAAQQSLWHNMRPDADIVPCRTVDQGTDFRSSCKPQPAASQVTDAVRTGAFIVGGAPQTPTETMHVWKSKIRGFRGPDTLTPDTTVLPTATAQFVDDAVSVKFQAAATNCPSAATLTKSKPTISQQAFVVNLATDDIGFDISAVNNGRVCLRAVPVDAAGNEGTAADIFVRWDTVDPPLTVLVNPPADADPLAANPFSAAASEATSFFSGGQQYSLLHAYVSNPYPFPVNVRIAQLPTLRIDVSDTLSRNISQSGTRGQTTTGQNNGTTGWPGDIGLTMKAPGSNLGNSASAAVQGWTVSGIAATDDDTGNQIFVKVTDATDPRRPAGLKVADAAPTTGVTTVVNTRDSLNFAMQIDAIQWFSVDAATGVVGSQIAAVNNHVTVPAATTTGIGLQQRTVASVVVGVLVGKVPAGVSYGIVPPTGDIDDPPMLRGEPGVGATSGVSPNVTTRRFVVKDHPVMGPVVSPNVQQETGFFVHATNGTGTLAERTRCVTPVAAANATCRFYKRWFELEELRLVLNVTDPQRTALLKLFTISTRETGGTVNNFSATTAQVEPHPFYADLAVSKDVVRTSDAP